MTRLRTATAPDHEFVEDTMPLMDDHLERATYLRVLSRLCPIVAAWEIRLASDAQLPADSFITPRNRLPLLLDDLRTLSAGSDALPECELPAFDGHAQLMGAMYVMEGSRLGGQLIARHVEKILSLAPGEGTSYFRGFADRTGPMWKEFVATLSSDVPDSETDEVIVGAKKMFAAFGNWMRAW